MTGKHFSSLASTRVPEAYQWWTAQLIRQPPQSYPMDRNWSSEHWPLLADDLWRIAHSDRNGSRRLEPHVVGLGLGAALVLELILTGQIIIDGDDRLHLNSGLRAELDRNYDFRLPDMIAQHFVLTVMAEPEPRPVADWISYAAQDALDRVSKRMLQAKHLIEEPRRFGRGPTYHPASADESIWPAIRLRGPLENRSLPQIDLILLGLCRATGLHRLVYAQENSVIVDWICGLPNTLPPLFDRVLSHLDSLVAHKAARLR